MSLKMTELNPTRLAKISGMFSKQPLDIRLCISRSEITNQILYINIAIWWRCLCIESQKYPLPWQT